MIVLKGKPISVNKLYQGRRFLTDEGKAVKLDYGIQATRQNRKPLEGELEVEISFYLKNKRSDIDNCLKATLDILSGILWKDDSQIMELLVHKIIDKEERVEIEARRI